VFDNADTPKPISITGRHSEPDAFAVKSTCHGLLADDQRVSTVPPGSERAPPSTLQVALPPTQ